VYGLPYRTPEEREAYSKELTERMAARRSELAAATNASRHRNDCDDEKTVTQAEYDRERRKEAEAIRVANGGAPAQQRNYSCDGEPMVG
jgi:hypothetical protein